MDPLIESEDDHIIQPTDPVPEMPPSRPPTPRYVVDAVTGRLNEHAARMEGLDARATRQDDNISSLRVEAKRAEEAAARAEALARETTAKLAAADERPVADRTPAVAAYIGAACGVVSLVWLLLNALGV